MKTYKAIALVILFSIFAFVASGCSPKANKLFDGLVVKKERIIYENSDTENLLVRNLKTNQLMLLTTYTGPRGDFHYMTAQTGKTYRFEAWPYYEGAYKLVDMRKLE